MPCLAHEHRHRLPATNNHCKSLSCLVRETYAHCRVPCLGVPAAGWSSGDDSEDGAAVNTKQVILNEMRNRGMRKRSSSRCGVDSPTLSSAFVCSFTLLHTVSVLEKVSSPEKEEKEEAASRSDDDSEAFFSVKSVFTRSTGRAATVASSTWEGFRDCKGWPFGLCRRPAVPPLPSTPADSWKWRKRSSSSNLAVRHEHSPSPQRSPAPVNQTATTQHKEELSLSIRNGTPKLLVYNGTTQGLQMK